MNSSVKDEREERDEEEDAELADGDSSVSNAAWKMNRMMRGETFHLVTF